MYNVEKKTWNEKEFCAEACGFGLAIFQGKVYCFGGLEIQLFPYSKMKTVELDVFINVEDPASAGLVWKEEDILLPRCQSIYDVWGVVDAPITKK